MKFEKVIKLNDAQFRRVTGIKRATFEKMVSIMQEAEIRKRAKGGRPNKLSLQDRILMTLEYLREYRTYMHIGASYGLSESNAYQSIRWIEDTLIKSKEFRLPGKKALLANDNEFDIVLIDVTETPIERPKKNNGNSTQAKRNVIL